jgi:hypothetical protein
MKKAIFCGNFSFFFEKKYKKKRNDHVMYFYVSAYNYCCHHTLKNITWKYLKWYTMFKSKYYSPVIMQESKLKKQISTQTMQKQLASQKLLKTTTTKHVFFKISNYQK